MEKLLYPLWKASSQSGDEFREVLLQQLAPALAAVAGVHGLREDGMFVHKSSKGNGKRGAGSAANSANSIGGKFMCGRWRFRSFVLVFPGCPNVHECSKWRRCSWPSRTAPAYVC